MKVYVGDRVLCVERAVGAGARSKGTQIDGRVTHAGPGNIWIGDLLEIDPLDWDIEVLERAGPLMKPLTPTE